MVMFGVKYLKEWTSVFCEIGLLFFLISYRLTSSSVLVWYGMVWYGMVWYGMVWYGMVWYGMVWYGMVWYGMVWYGMVWYAFIFRVNSILVI